MDLQHFEGAVCLASFRQLWSGFSSPGHWVIEYCRPASGQGLSRKLLWCDFSLNQCCRSTDLWLLRPYRAHKLHPELRYSSTHRMTKYLAINPSDHNTWCAIMSTPSSLLAFFFTGKLCLGSMVHLEFLLTTLCLVSSGFLANLFLISFCIQNRLRENHCLRSPSFCTVCMVCPLRKWPWWNEEAKREKGWGMNRLQIKIMVLKFCSSCYTCACLQPLTKYWSIYAKAATIVSPV